VRKIACLLVLAIAATPVLAPGQKKEDIVSLQRDVADLEDRIRQVQKSQDEKLDVLKRMVQEALDTESKNSATLTTLQRNLTDTLTRALADQKKTLDPLADRLVDVRTKANQTSDDVGTLRESVADLQRRVNAMDSKLSDILTQLHLLTQPPAPPPSATAVPGTAFPGTAASGPPAGFSCIGAYQDARGDYSGGRDELAMQGFVNMVMYCHDDSNAPTAQYYIGMLYDRAGQYDQAAEAFDRVVEQFSKNPRTCESMYRKGDELRKAKHPTDAAAALNDFIKSCPGDERIASARADLRALGMAPAAPRNTKKK
jgi:TolA-binding protein